MNFRNILLIQVLVFICVPSCKKYIESNDKITNAENIETLMLKLENEYTTVYLVHPDKKTISSSEIALMFLDGWDFQDYVTISGYTATDDLWTVLSYKDEIPETPFDLVKIELIDIEEGSIDWLNCIESICNIVNDVPHIIIQDPDEICEN